MRQICLLILNFSLIFAISACGSSSSDKTAPQSAPILNSPNRGALFTAIDAEQGFYSLYFYNFSAGIIQLVHSGESRDPAVLLGSERGRFWLFERHRDEGKIYKGNMSDTGEISVELLSSGGLSLTSPGDPGTIINRQEEKSSLFIMPNLGAVFLTDENLSISGDVFTREKFELSQALLPIDGITASDGNFYVLNQGFSPLREEANNQQALLKFNYENAALDATAQKYPLEYMAPRIAIENDSVVRIISLCPVEMIDNACSNGLEDFSIESKSVVQNHPINLGDQGLSGSALAASDTTFYAQTRAAGVGSTQQITRIDYNEADNTFAVNKQRGLETQDIVALLYDKDAGALIYGEKTNYNNSGRLFIEAVGIYGDMELAEVPYNGVILE
jgi:hypothetical protein